MGRESQVPYFNVLTASEKIRAQKNRLAKTNHEKKDGIENLVSCRVETICMNTS
jgi:hypothetical protein